nr:calcium-binding protein [Oceaniglobus trochenteri]
MLAAGTATNPLPGSGFAAGEGIALSSLPNGSLTEDDLIVGTDAPERLDGGIGDDTIRSEGGDDTVLGGEGDDLLDGGNDGDLLNGGAGNDTIRGFFGDDTLFGGEGVDELRGGPGSDIYWVSSGTDDHDVLIESRDFEGTDRVIAEMDYTLVGHFEELELTGNGNFRGIGNDLDNLLLGNVGNNTLDGGMGNDTLEGGMGDDLYILRDAGDVVSEARYAGDDTVHAYIETAAIENVENIALKMTQAANLFGNVLNNELTGNMADNAIFGGRGNDTLIGQGGDDTLNGGDGYDTMIGGDGSDTYVVTSGSRYYSRYGDRVVELDIHSGTDHVIAVNTNVDLRGEHVENISVTGSSSYLDVLANNLDNSIRITSVGQYIDVFGYGGDDRIVMTKDRSIDLYGGDGNDTLISGAGQDRLDGGAGADVMAGGLGNDSYFINDVGDRVIEAANGGNDTLFSTLDTNLAAALESLYLQGDARVGNGNAGDNRITGNNADNLLQGLGGNDSLFGDGGNDTLRGGAGDDTYYGGRGDDTYFIEDAGDLLRSEYSGNYYGRDTVIASVSVDFTQSYQDIENITLVGTDDIDASRYDGRYGTLSGTLRGNSGDNVLNGAARAVDTMLGGLGDDVYVVENKQDVVIEGFGAGDDMIRTSVDYALSAHVERLRLLGDAEVGIGNGLDNVIVGSGLGNTIAGREGSDTITGNGGNDTFVFDRALGADNIDTITDFLARDDQILLRSNVFAGLDRDADDHLRADNFHLGTSAGDANDHIIYDRDTGQLWYDADGSGAAAQQLFAVLSNQNALAADDFNIV